MKIEIQSIHFTIDSKLKEYITSKIAKIEKYNDNITNTKVILKLENSGQVKDKLVEIITNIPGDTFVSKEESKSFESSFDLAFDGLKRQVKRHKEKIISKKRASSKI